MSLGRCASAIVEVVKRNLNMPHYELSQLVAQVMVDWREQEKKLEDGWFRPKHE